MKDVLTVFSTQRLEVNDRIVIDDAIIRVRT